MQNNDYAILYQIYSELDAHPYATTGKSDTVALTGVENIHFPQLKSWVQNAINAKVYVYPI